MPADLRQICRTVVYKFVPEEIFNSLPNLELVPGLRSVLERIQSLLDSRGQQSSEIDALCSLATHLICDVSASCVALRHWMAIQSDGLWPAEATGSGFTDATPRLACLGQSYRVDATPHEERQAAATVAEFDDPVEAAQFYVDFVSGITDQDDALGWASFATLGAATGLTVATGVFEPMAPEITEPSLTSATLFDARPRIPAPLDIGLVDLGERQIVATAEHLLVVDAENGWIAQLEDGSWRVGSDQIRETALALPCFARQNDFNLILLEAHELLVGTPVKVKWRADPILCHIEHDLREQRLLAGLFEASGLPATWAERVPTAFVSAPTDQRTVAMTTAPDLGVYRRKGVELELVGRCTERASQRRLAWLLLQQKDPPC